MTFYEKVNDLCNRNGFRISFIRDYVKTMYPTTFNPDKATVSHWKKNPPSRKTMTMIANYFDVPVEWLENDDLDFSHIEFHPVNESIKYENAAETSLPVQVSLPIYGTVSAGNGVLAQEDIIGYASCDSAQADGNHFFLKVYGDSMEPLLRYGDILLCRKQDSVDSGSIGVFLVDGEFGYVKKVMYGNDYINLISINPAYPPKTFVGEEVLRVKVIGKCLEVRSQL